jgi:hypothetical protein
MKLYNPVRSKLLTAQNSIFQILVEKASMISVSSKDRSQRMTRFWSCGPGRREEELQLSLICVTGSAELTLRHSVMQAAGEGSSAIDLKGF